MKLFVCSDIHGYYNEMIVALRNAGFEKNNPEHMLIVLGDCFDRGLQSRQVLKYLESIENKVIVKGNHETLLLEACERGYPSSYDNDNGTTQTICDLGNFEYDMDFQEACERTLKRVKPFIDSMVNYYETEHYVFVHGWISMMDNFRDASQEQWNDATWMCGPDMAMHGCNNTGKIIVCGHWNSSYLWHIEKGFPEFGYGACYDPYFMDDAIFIDTATAISRRVNVLVLEDELLEG